MWFERDHAVFRETALGDTKSDSPPHGGGGEAALVYIRMPEVASLTRYE